MKYTVAFSLLAAMGAMAQTFSINTPPSLVQCQPAALSWMGGTEPFILAAIPGGQVSAAALETIATDVQGNSYTWDVNLPEGTSVTIKITDKTGAIAYDSQSVIQAGADNSCLNANASTSAAAGATSGAASSSAAASSAASATSAAASASSAAGQSTTAHSSASSASGTTASASKSSSTSTSASSSAAASSGAAIAGSAVQLPALVLAGLGAVAALF